ncbi:hypothetical protein BASA81_004658 [Batrachochytrium salamandrivorans]|nr:hypothetical protein BASA81_004658 [Batrachochytrium salamandrivorans]
MTRVGRKRQHHCIRDVKRAARTRARTKDMDQIFEDMAKPTEFFTVVPLDTDLPGMGQNYCIQCARHFITEDALTVHRGTKLHKKRVKFNGPGGRMGNSYYLIHHCGRVEE